MKAFTKGLLGAALLSFSVHSSAAIVDLTGTADASGFAERPTGFIGTPVPGPFDPLFASFALSYDDMLAPLDGELNVALTMLTLDIGGAMFDASNSSAKLNFELGMLVGVTVGADANGGLDSLLADTDDFLFSNVSGTQVFQYTVAGTPGVSDGLFETLFTPGPDPDIGQVVVAFGAAQAVSAPVTAALVAFGLLALAAPRRRRAVIPGAMPA